MAINSSSNDPCVDAPSDIADLLPRVGDGDPAAWEEIIHRYGAIVFVKVRSFRLQEADTLDAVQSTWLRLAENVHQIRDPQRQGGWLSTTAHRECLRILRHVARSPALPKAAQENLPDSSAGPEEVTIDADTTQWLWKHVDHLPPRQRTLLRALFTESRQPYTKIATISGVPPGGIGPTRARALQQLRKRLDQHRVQWSTAGPK